MPCTNVILIVTAARDGDEAAEVKGITTSRYAEFESLLTALIYPAC
jgi:hypothetical protein